VPTVKFIPALGTIWTVTTTGPGPVMAPDGTGTEILVFPQAEGVAFIPLKVTVLEPCDAPKYEPEIVTKVDADPDGGASAVMVGTPRTMFAVVVLAAVTSCGGCMAVKKPDADVVTL
jgi:hypothetical protein